MASPSNLLKLVIAVVFSLVLSLPTLSVCVSASAAGGGEWKKMELGSKPPQCDGKCLSCRPCTAVLVVPEHRELKGFEDDLNGREEEEDDSYYLLHWECKCGNKLYNP